MKKLLLISVMFVIAMSVRAQESDIITDRPDQTESPFAVKKGIVQIESGLLFERVRLSNLFSQHRSVYPTNLFRIGLVEKLELRVVNEVVKYRIVNNLTQETVGSVSGTENMQIGLKYQFSQDDSPTVVGVMAHTILPTGSEGISNERYGIISRINISHDISENKNISANFGYNNFDLGFEEGRGLVRYADGNFTYTLVYGVGLGDRVGLYLEAFGDYVEFDSWENNMDAGMTFLLKNNIQLDYSYGWGLNRVMNYHSVGISIRLPK